MLHNSCFLKPTLHGIILIVAVSVNSTVSAEDWPRWRGVRGDGTWRAPELAEEWPAELRRVWQRPVGGGYGGIAVVGEQLFVMDRQTEPVERERLLCCDTKTGETRWEASYPVAYGKLDYGNGPRCTPTVDGGKVFTLGAVGHVACTDAVTGRIVWQHDLVQEYGAKIPDWGLAASPVLHEKLVIVHPGVPENGCLMAFHRETGKLVWQAGADPAGYATPILAQTPSGLQLIAWTPEHILGLNPDSGEIYWRVPYKVTYRVSIATPIYQEGLVLVCGYWEGSKAIRLGNTPESAELVWEENRFLRGLMSQPLYRAEKVFLLEKQYGLTCFDLQTGEKRWDDGNQLTPRGRNPQANLVWLDGESDRVLLLNSDGELLLARLKDDGIEELQRRKVIGETWAHPAFAGRFVYARTDSEMICVELPGR